MYERPQLEGLTDITFFAMKLVDFIPHEDDPIVLSVILMGKNVLKVLIDQGSSTDVMFWDTFVGLQISKEQLQRFHRVLVGFFGEHVKVKGYVELGIVKYMVVNAPSS